MKISLQWAGFDIISIKCIDNARLEKADTENDLIIVCDSDIYFKLNS